MSSSNKATTTVLAVVVTLVVAGAGGYMLGNRSGQANTKAVATVNGEAITQTDLYEAMVKEQGPATLEQMINARLIAQEAKKNNVTVSQADVDAELNKTIESMGGQEAFQQALQYYGMTEEQLRQSILQHLQATKILGKDIVVDETELKQFFDENQRQLDKRQVKARHILVETEAEAKEIKAQLDGGADFTALAKEKSIEPAAKETGGDLGTFGRNMMVPEFEQAAFSMQKGEISNPVQTQHGWHVIQVLDITGEAPDFEKQKAEITDQFIQMKVGEQSATWMAGLKEKAKITNTLAQ